MKKFIGEISGFVLIIALITAWAFYSYEPKAVFTSAGVLSNQKIEWGVKRNENNEQPEFGKTNTELMEKYKCIYVGNKQDKYVYLTFDLGYEAGYTAKILDTLKEKNVQATFFITAHYVNTASELIQRMINEKQIIGNHTKNHKSLPSLSDDTLKEEVMKLHQVVYEKYGYEMKYIRPPKGEYSERVLELLQSYGYINVMWSLAYDDWDENKQGRTDYAKEKILSNIHPGAVILLHATSKDNTEILGEVIDKVRNMGYEFKSLEEFVY